MSLTTPSLSAIPTCYASCSIGCRASDTLPKKLAAISGAGFSAIELAFPDILSFASSQLRKDVGPYDYDDICDVGKQIKKLCQEHNLKIFILQPFSNFEGWPQGSPKREDAFRRVKGWIRVMEAVGTDTLQVGSSDSPDMITDREYIVSDLRLLADMLAEHNFRLAYENWCWSTHAPTWYGVWDIVKKVDKPNVGLCLDTFQTAGSEWADPTTQTGMMLLKGEHGGGKEEEELEFNQSLEKLAKTIPEDKIYFLQISDAYKPKRPFSKDVDETGTRPKGRWSHDFRPMPFDGGYLPVVAVTKAVLRTGFRGYFSMEIFDSGPEGKGKDYDMIEFAKQAMASHKRLLAECAES
ncbi:MAG: hypothetical protein M1819_003654 [Sarea resinae]|nr:MAG: hypothetical protein M1819_003654 [Sarea resinae]